MGFITTGAERDLQGYVRSSDFGGELWRNVYWKGGFNTLDMINIAREQKKWDIAGVGLALQAYGWQYLTDYSGEIILKEAFDVTKSTFAYDIQDTVYAVVDRLCKEALVELNKSSDGVGSPAFVKFDMMYKGDRNKWIKFVNGILAHNAHHLIKKSFYKPQDVINYVNASFANNTDDALVPFLGTSSTDANPQGPRRQNFGSYGQSAFIVRLTGGNVFSGAVDPRQAVMLNPSTDGTFRGLNPGAGQSTAVSNSASGVRSVWNGTLGTNPTAGTGGKYLFNDNAPFPLMTYAELQFIKAEAALKMNDKATAFDAYKKGVNAHFDFVQNGATAPGASSTPNNLSAGPYSFGAPATFAAQRATYLANTAVIPANENNLTINQIMLQKYIALWGWGYIETWTDLRKFDYDPAIFTSWAMPPSFFVDNAGKPAYRIRPRYNSEYVWNIDALNKINGFNPDYHTYKMWIQLP
jgi:hypothetical protein